MGVFEEVSNALYGNRWLTIEYRNASGKTTTSDVMPLGLAQQGPRMYLVCRYRDYDNERSLALHRILSAKASTLTFVRPKSFDLQKYDDDGRFGFGDGQRIKLSFLAERDVVLILRESPLSGDQVIDAVGSKFKVTSTVVDTLQLKKWLFGFGDDVSQIRKLRIAVPRSSLAGSSN
jgi:predicted DNA-binding transcriptional regulator YafY